MFYQRLCTITSNTVQCSGLTVGLWESSSTRGAGFGQTREGPWKQTIVMVADIFRFRLFHHVCPHGGQNFCGNWKVWRKTSATHSSASRPRSTPGWLLHLEIQFCLDLKRLNKNCFRRFLQILDCFEKMDFDYQMFTCSSEEQAPMAPTRASRSTPPLEHQPYCRFEYFCKTSTISPTN